jgi:hypothetical protein
MKATTVIIAAVLFFQINILFAGNDEVRPITANVPASTTITALAPVTPAEANFEETTFMVSDATVASLAPVVPAEADFNDITDAQSSDLSKLAPTTPSEADFE